MTPENIQKLQSLFRIGSDNPITLRALRGRDGVENLTFRAADFPHIEDRWTAFANAAGDLNRQGYNIYTCLNPINPHFVGEAVCDADILCRRLLLIDLDRASNTQVPATDDEIRLAVRVADRVAEWLRRSFGEVPTRVLSGNGIHLYVQLADLPNDRASLDLCKQVLRTLASKFNTDAIKIDTSVSNASRITKVPGTIARKGAQTADRTYREAMFL